MSLKIKGQLKEAQIENLASDPVNQPEGRVWLNTVTNKLKAVINSVVREVVTNDVLATDSATNLKITSNLSDLNNAGTARANIGLGNVDNTSDANKPVSTAQATADATRQLRSTLTTKGDLYVATASDAVTRLAVGTDGKVLTADSGQATGLNWTTPLANPMSAQGDIIYGGVSGAVTKLAAGTAGKVLQTNGVAAPTWVTPRPAYNAVKSSTSSGLYATSSTSFVDVTNMTATITTTGGPVRISMLPIGTGGPQPVIGGYRVSDAFYGVIAYFRDGVQFGASDYRVTHTGATFTSIAFTPAIMYDYVAAGTYVYKLQARVTTAANSCEFSITEYHLLLEELN